MSWIAFLIGIAISCWIGSTIAYRNARQKVFNYLMEQENNSTK